MGNFRENEGPVVNFSDLQTVQRSLEAHEKREREQLALRLRRLALQTARVLEIERTAKR